MDGTRYKSLDAIRGFAVMGILLMNIVAFAMPEAAYISPIAWGGTTPPDLLSWGVMWVLVDGKMRGLFSMLFGASMLLVYESAQARDGSGRQTHFSRMLWLLFFGAIHYYLIWFGDILMLYALCGLCGVFLLKRDEEGLRKSAILLFILAFFMMALIAGGLFAYQFAASRPGATQDIVDGYNEMRVQLGIADPSAYAKDIALMRGSWWGIAAQQLTDGILNPVATFMMSALETLGLMALGMYLFRTGFLTGALADAEYQQAMKRAYTIGLPPLAAMAVYNWTTGFDPITNMAIFLCISMPFRIAVMLGHAALLMLVIRRLAASPLLARVEAAGKAAFTNYLGTSILMTGLFYGWGLGQFGYWSRWQVYLVVPVVCAIMLLWSKPWLDRFHYGPLEWLWRSLARGEWQPMRKATAPRQ